MISVRIEMSVPTSAGQDRVSSVAMWLTEQMLLHPLEGMVVHTFSVEEEDA